MEMLQGAWMGVPALITALAAWRQAAKANRNIGSPNGHGDVSQMLGHLIRTVERIDSRLDHHIQEHRSN